jgi:enoyl-CoA hydratase
MTTSNATTPVTWSVDDKGIATIRLNRPERLNALNLQVKRLIEAAIGEFESNDKVRVIIIKGENSVFVAGTDIAEMRDMTSSTHGVEKTDQVFHALRNCKKPLIAAVEKFALGGGFELALACDLIVADKNTRFAQPEIRVGIMPGAGGTQILLRTIGKYRAMKMILTGEQIDTDQAMEMGLISEVAETGKAYERAYQLAETISKMPPLAVAAIKDVVKSGQDMSLTSALLNEREAFVTLFDSEDQVEGMQAFMEKRAPSYKGK